MQRLRPPAPVRDATLDFVSEEFTLGNRSNVVVLPEPHAALVTLTSRFSTGAIDDPPDAAGMAHLAEHILFEIPLDGGSVESALDHATVYHNAETSLDATTFVEKFFPDDLARVVAIEAGRWTSSCSKIADDVFYRERAVVLQELRERHARQALALIIQSALFGEQHPYARVAGGNAEQVAGLSKQRVCDFIAENYAAHDALYILSGPVSMAQASRAMAPLGQRSSASKRASLAHDISVAGPMETRGRRLSRTADITDNTLLLAWNLPVDPQSRARAFAVGSMIAQRIDFLAYDAGMDVTMAELGGEKAGFFAIAISGAHSTFDQLTATASDGVRSVLDEFSQFGFEHARESQMVVLQRRFGDVDDRIALASYYQTHGVSSAAGYYRDVAALGSMTLDDVKTVVRDTFQLGVAREIAFTPSNAAEHIELSKLGSLDKIHVDRSTTTIDASAADQAIKFAWQAPVAQEQRLANGLRVVMIPNTDAGLIHASLVFGSGFANEAGGQRGVAQFAAQCLQPPLTDQWASAFRSGIATSSSLTTDVTVFRALGQPAFVDFVLGALGERVRDGNYDKADLAKQTAAAKSRLNDDAARLQTMTQQRSAALFGANHPYAKAGMPWFFDWKAIGIGQVAAFRRAHYVPANATLFITGKFDPKVALTWVDYWFSDWAGPLPPRQVGQVGNGQGGAFGVATRDPQLGVLWSFATAATQSSQSLAKHQMVAAMLSEAVKTVRQEIAASYGVYVDFNEGKQGGSVTIHGNLDVTRAVDALAIIQKRLVQIVDGSQQSKAWFVSSRRILLANALRQFQDSESVMQLVSVEVAAERDLVSLGATAQALAEVTYRDVADLAATLLRAEHSVMVISGPRDATARAFASLSVTPTWITP
jgi:zinc protease